MSHLSVTVMWILCQVLTMPPNSLIVLTHDFLLANDLPSSTSKEDHTKKNVVRPTRSDVESGRYYASAWSLCLLNNYRVIVQILQIHSYLIIACPRD